MIDAASNFDIAQSLDKSWFHSMLETLITDITVSTGIKKNAKLLYDKIRGWTSIIEVLEDRPTASFGQATEALKLMTSSENVCGTWLIGMVTNPSLSRLLHIEFKEADKPSRLMSDVTAAVSVNHGSFSTFVRAIVGVASVLAAYAWSDAWPDIKCRERCLSILRLWENVEGYHEVSMVHFR